MIAFRSGVLLADPPAPLRLADADAFSVGSGAAAPALALVITSQVEVNVAVEFDSAGHVLREDHADTTSGWPADARVQLGDGKNAFLDPTFAHASTSHLKSLLASIAFPAWCVGRDPSAQILCVSMLRVSPTSSPSMLRDTVAPIGLRCILQTGLQSSGHKRTPVNRRTLVFGLLAISYVKPGNAAGWTLISKEEFERDSAAPHSRGLFAPTAQSGAPLIEIEQPNETKPIKVPVTIRLRFLPQTGAAIDPTSFRATYGWLAIDITQRIIEHAQVNAAGLSASGADIPPGHHKVTLQIADNVHRVGIRTFEFTVV